MLTMKPTLKNRNNNIRLSAHDLSALETLFKKHFLKEDTLWIFGSRVNSLKKGGDIDLYIETKAESANEAANMKNKFIISLEEEIGEQKIDVVLNLLKFPYELPIYIIAKEQGVRIV